MAEKVRESAEEVSDSAEEQKCLFFLAEKLAHLNEFILLKILRCTTATPPRPARIHPRECTKNLFVVGVYGARGS